MRRNQSQKTTPSRNKTFLDVWPLVFLILSMLILAAMFVLPLYAADETGSEQENPVDLPAQPTQPVQPVQPVQPTQPVPKAKTTEELQEEMSGKIDELNNLTAHDEQKRPDILYNTLTPADIQTPSPEPDELSTSASASATNRISLSSSINWIPIALCVTFGIILIFLLSMITRKIVMGCLKDDFIK